MGLAPLPVPRACARGRPQPTHFGCERPRPCAWPRKLKLVGAVKKELLWLVQGLRHQALQACTSFRPCTRAWVLADTPYALRQCRPRCKAAAGAVQPKPMVPALAAASTWGAVQMTYNLPGCGYYRAREGLTTAALWADEHFAAEDEVECQKSFLRWYRGPKRQARAAANCSAAHIMCCARPVCKQWPPTAHIGSGPPHTNGRAGKPAQALSAKRVRGMLVLEPAPMVGSDWAPAPLPAVADGLAYLKAGLVM